MFASAFFWAAMLASGRNRNPNSCILLTILSHLASTMEVWMLPPRVSLATFLRLSGDRPLKEMISLDGGDAVHGPVSQATDEEEFGLDGTVCPSEFQMQI